MQSYALIILNHLDVVETAKSRVDALKGSLVAAGGDLQILFPEYTPKPDPSTASTEEEIDNAPADANWDYTNVEWKSPSDDPGAFEALMAKLKDGPQTFTGSDVGPEGGEITWTDWQ